MTPTPLPAPPEGALRLAVWGVVRASGADARSFLQGQLTQDIASLAPGEARLAGYCSAKGRLLASFVVWLGPDGDVMLACSADVLPGVLKRLSMFVLRAKCKLGDASAEVPLWGVAGPLGVDPMHATHAQHAMRLPDAAVGGARVPRWLLAGGIAPPLPALDADAWQWLEVHSGVPRIVAATAEQFVPQMVNLELVEGVNFQKGCYPGQEVVARSQYRGTLKRRSHLFYADAALAPGQEVFHDSDATQPAGMVVLAACLPSAPAGTQHAALVSIKSDLMAEGTLHAGGTGAHPLRPGALPYAVAPAAA